MHQDEVNRSLWENAALKLLKGKPLSSLTKIGLSGLKTNVLYADRPAQYTTSASGTQTWSAIEVQGRVAGRFQMDASWTAGLKPTFTRLYHTDTVSQLNGRVEVLGAEFDGIVGRLQQKGDEVFHVDPFVLELLGKISDDSEDNLETLLALLQSQDGAHPLTIDASVIFELGGTAKEELLWALLSLLQYAKRGVSWSTIWLHFSADASIMQTVVKFRALRQMIHGLATQLNIDVEYPYICAETSLRIFSRADEHNNMLRGLYASVGAVWGGVDGLIIHGYDVLSSSSEHAHRIAQNMHAVLKEESGLDNWMDPLFGSYQIESQTHELCTLVWSEFVEHSEGGIRRLIQSGFLQRLHQLRRVKHTSLAVQKSSVTGVTAFANPTEQLGTEWVTTVSSIFIRDVQQIEILRAQFESVGPMSVQIVCLGTSVECKPRLEYLQQQLSTVGMHGETVQNWNDSASLRCLVGTDKAYATQAQSILDNVQTSGTAPIWIVGRPFQDSRLLEVLTPIYKGVNMIERWSEVLKSVDDSAAGLAGEEQ